MIFEGLLFEFKLNYDWYLNLSTLEQRILTITRMTVKPRRLYTRTRKLPKLIVKIDMDPEK